jgi:ribosomal protein L11 methyltransferase
MKRKVKTWHKVTVSVAKENAEMVRDAMGALPCTGIQAEDEAGGREHLDAYFEEAIDPKDLARHMEVIAALIEAAGGRKLQIGTIEEIAEEDWAEEWRKTWKPIRVTRRIIVCPSWQTYDAAPEQIVIYIYPRMAFGTGNHPTTRICLKLLELYLPQGSRVIDIGAGSGILSIAAAKLRARKVTAVEMDEAAIENAVENARFNKVLSKIDIKCERFGSDFRGAFDIGICNMLSHEMIPLIPDITRLLKGKCLIISGLSRESAPEARAAFLQNGWRIRKTVRKGEWVGCYLTHQSTQSSKSDVGKDRDPRGDRV